VGTPPALVYVLPSTVSTSTWVVGAWGCNQSYNLLTLPGNCNATRGGVFDNSTSSTWDEKGNYGLKVEEYLGEKVEGEFGFDDVDLGYTGSGVSLQNTTVAWFIDQIFAVGMFGLSYRPTNFSLAAWDMVPSFLGTLYAEKKIPSLSYGYTAGAYYRKDAGGQGSLVLGGYDRSLFVPNSLVFPFNEDQSVDLTVGLQGIYASNILSTNALFSGSVTAKLVKRSAILTQNNGTETSTTATSIAKNASPATQTSRVFTAVATTNPSSSTNLLPTPSPFFIDSTTSHVWLPEEACSQFEKAFGLVHDSDSDLYLVNDTQHEALLALNPSITFSLTLTYTVGSASAPVINITFPYAAFDLWVTWGYNISGPSRYFPIRRAANNTQYVLGRTFLQEAYLYVDNNYQNFTVSQRVWPYPVNSEILPQEIITHFISPAVYVAMGVSIAVFLALATFSIWLYLRRKRLAEERRKEEEAEAARKAKEEEDTIVPDPFATPDGVINEIYTEKWYPPLLDGMLLPFSGAEVDGSHASERRYELGRGMEGIEGRHELEAPHGLSQAPGSEEGNESTRSESKSERKSVDVTETEVSRNTETRGGSEAGIRSPREHVSPESTNRGGERAILGGEDPVSPMSPNPNQNMPVKLQNDRHLIYGFF
jgi:hypothetical protein